MSDISYHIHGSDLQFVEVTLPPNSSVIGEQGAMMYMDDHLQVDTVLGDGSNSSFGAVGRFFKAVKRTFTGESLFSGRYLNPLQKEQRVAFAAPTLGKIIPIDLSKTGGQLICQKGAFLAGESGTEVNLAWQKRLRVGFFGGEGFIMQRITGKGVVFINATGALTEMDLSVGQALRVDSGCLVALSSSVTYDINYAGKIKTAIFGGEGLFYASLQGPGRVWIQSLPMSRLSAEIMGNALAGNKRGMGGKFYVLLVIIVALFSLFSEQ